MVNFASINAFECEAADAVASSDVRDGGAVSSVDIVLVLVLGEIRLTLLPIQLTRPELDQ